MTKLWVVKYKYARLFFENVALKFKTKQWIIDDEAVRTEPFTNESDLCQWMESLASDFGDDFLSVDTILLPSDVSVYKTEMVLFEIAFPDFFYMDLSDSWKISTQKRQYPNFDNYNPIPTLLF